MHEPNHQAIPFLLGFLQKTRDVSAIINSGSPCAKSVDSCVHCLHVFDIADADAIHVLFFLSLLSLFRRRQRPARSRSTYPRTDWFCSFFFNAQVRGASSFSNSTVSSLLPTFHRPCFVYIIIISYNTRSTVTAPLNQPGELCGSMHFCDRKVGVRILTLAGRSSRLMLRDQRTSLPRVGRIIFLISIYLLLSLHCFIALR